MLRGKFPRYFRGTLPCSLAQTRQHLNPLCARSSVRLKPGQTLGSFTPKRTFVESVVTQTQEYITAFHFLTGTPWYLTIALVAFGVNIARLPFFIYTRRIQQQRVELTPLIYAWYARIAKSTPPTPWQTTDQVLKDVLKKIAKRQQKIYREFGLQQWRLNGTIITLPIWLGVMESLRRLCGGPAGILGAIFFKNDQVTDAAVGTAQSSAPTPLANTASATMVEPASTVSMGTISDVALPAAATLEPTLATGGLFWFPDLLVADPYHVLPCILSFTIAVNLGLIPTSVKEARLLLGGEPSTQDAAMREPRARARKSLRRALLICTLAIAPITVNFPAALHLYWICSSGISMLFTHIVRWCMPLPKPIAARCQGQNRLMLLPRPCKDSGRRVKVFH